MGLFSLDKNNPAHVVGRFARKKTIWHVKLLTRNALFGNIGIEITYGEYTSNEAVS